MIASLVFSFVQFELLHPENMQFVGLRNYQRLLTDPVVGLSLNNTFKFALIALPLAVFVPIGLATLLNAERLGAKRLFRTLFYMPYMVPVVSAVYIWGGVLNSETGWINRLLEGIGIAGPSWLNSTTWIYPALNIMGLWGVGNAMLYTLAAMQGVPTELYEAAKVDGANPFSRFRNITLPMISPVIFYNLVLSIVGLWRYFEAPFILKEGTGDPGGSTMFINIHLYRTAFLFQDMGYGSALAWLLFALAFGSTLILFATRRYWVYYAAEE
ncbi:MAG: sugar ABC transporter permease [Anaerolineae bacterium]|nr:sugar ABC transporter permease [Anaerolineae bacterium]